MSSLSSYFGHLLKQYFLIVWYILNTVLNGRLPWWLRWLKKKKKSACNVGDLGSIPGLGRSIEEGMATHSSILAWRIPMDRGAWRATVHGLARSRTSLSD